MSAAAPTTRPRSRARIALYVLQVVLGLFMVVGSGAPKLFGEATAVQTFDAIGAGDWFRYVIGALEVAGGIGLMIPILAGLAAACFVALMIGAALFQVLVIGMAEYVSTPIVLGVLFALIAWVRRHEIAALFRR
ncbi:DoxX family protein [Pseudonocardia sp. RS11V-5]|uniref:DoxX family protein n=1 Tax=Pseudonocardia terrae TaxID=2905831 RepID=UPI001E423A6F|nr:DoxX family protein [Pseudonocardia terrae]MCE3553076.1 DoxX family protein [Pseudonocardia terrae]